MTTRPKIDSWEKAREHLLDRRPEIEPAALRAVWSRAGGYTFLERDIDGERSLWHIGPRGGVNRGFHVTAVERQMLAEAGF